MGRGVRGNLCGRPEKVGGLDTFDLASTRIDGFVPSWRYSLSVHWAFQGFGLGYNLWFIRGIRKCENNDCREDNNNLVRGVDPNIIQDVFGSISLSNPLGVTSLRVGVNNLSDEAPPRIYAGFLANSDAANYDFLGRYFYAGLRHRF